MAVDTGVAKRSVFIPAEGEDLVELMKHSDAVFDTILVASDRHWRLQAIKLEAMERPLRELLGLIESGRRDVDFH